ncbi:MAG: hypothetical protein A3F72_17125 [Bacteroidetes bacterium RIFCSPLOWO2_12_FULL_35_15]|nr:MAG: hypothetical protein A3F72_17125 [Bacteroidetes bacterium RIFCSPLOWO2_12_FULL_35_15]
MADLKFNIDKPDLPDEQINKHKDFKKLMYNYQTATNPLYKTPLYKNRKVYLVILIILLVMYVIIEVFEKDEQQQKKPSPQEQTK